MALTFLAILRFPKEKQLRRQWEVAVKREDFSANERSMLCSQHFQPEDFDRTGQNKVAARTTQASRKAEANLVIDCSLQSLQVTEPSPTYLEHTYALPPSPTLLKTRLNEALARVESLEKEMRNSKAREWRAKKTVCCLLEDLRGKNLINEELQERLDLYSDLPLGLLSKQGHEYTKEQREFALTLHLHGPKAYSYLRESLHLHLPHPLQSWYSI
ncbi:THAP domain-containing protein 2-like [Gadus macrocephalus]|uniref:THAP domain-containing protein 2-like n=1 Tax=Gadus macrocephalus TaxID=80720 RepID=UPI0028CB9FF6|nr:THAP domain-containing protein 2-like [Gadus macrocephalus]